MGQAGLGRAPGLYGRRHFTVTELEKVFVMRAQLGLGLEGHTASDCGLPAGWGSGMEAILLVGT